MGSWKAERKGQNRREGERILPFDHPNQRNSEVSSSVADSHPRSLDSVTEIQGGKDVLRRSSEVPALATGVEMPP